MTNYKCYKCKKWFAVPGVGPKVSCTVLHSPEQCCHYGETEIPPGPEERKEFLAQRDLLGKQVVVTVHSIGSDKVVVKGQLLAFGDGGDFEILDDDGFVKFCWPLLKMELAE